jgi:hypothetical protein
MDYYNKYLKYKYKFLELKNQLGGNHPKGTLFLYKYSENNVWSAILLYIKSNGEYVIEFDGIVVPDIYKDGSKAGPEDKMIMDIFDKSNLTVRLPEETDNEKRRAWSLKRLPYINEEYRKLLAHINEMTRKRLEANHPIGTLFLFKYSENKVWSAILRKIGYDNEYTIEFDGIVVPDIDKDGSGGGPQGGNFMKIYDVDKKYLTVRLPEETDDEKRKAWSEKRQAYQKEMTRKRNEADDVLFKSFHIGESVTYIETTYHSFGRGIEQWDKDITSTIVNMNRSNMTVELENKSIISIHSLKKLK